MESISKIISFEGFRTMAAWFVDKINTVWNDREARYAGAVYLTQAEYDALSEDQKMDASKAYFIEEQLS